MPTTTAALKAAEANALTQREPSYTSGSTSNSLYTGTGRSHSGGLKVTKKKRKGLIAGISAGALLLIGAIFLGNSNSLLPAAMSALFTENTDTQYSSYYMRQPAIMSAMLSGESDDITLPNAGVPDKLKENLANYGIEVQPANNTTASLKDAAGDAESVLIWEDGNKEKHIITSATFSDFFYNNVEFREAYMNAKQGRVANFFDNSAQTTYQERAISRNLFSDYTQTGNIEEDVKNFDDTMTPRFDGNQTGINTTAEGFVEWYERNWGCGPHGTGCYKNEKTWWEDYRVRDNDPLTAKGVSENGGQDVINNLIAKDIFEPKTVCNYGDDGSYDCTYTKRTPETIESRIGRIDIPSYSDTAISKCSLMSTSTIASSSIAVSQREAGIKMFMQIMENVSKMKAGKGDASAIHASMNLMSTPETITVQDFNTVTSTITEDDAHFEINSSTVTMSPLEETGVQMLLGGATVDSKKAKNNYSLERVILATGEGMGETTAYNTCDITETGANFVAFQSNLSNGGIFSYVTNFANEIFGSTMDHITYDAQPLISASYAKPIEGILAFINPTISTTLLSNMFTTSHGPTIGALVASGAYATNSLVGRQGSGQSFSGKKAALAHSKANNTVLAMDAEIERKNNSPFDITNRNTFFGSIAYSLLPTFTSSRFSTISSFLHTTSSAIGSIVGHSVFADGETDIENSSYMTTIGNCPLLESVGAVGDYYCNPLVSADLSTTSMPILQNLSAGTSNKALASLTNVSDNDYNKYRDVISESLEKKGDRYEVKKQGENLEDLGSLADYLDYCVNRESPVGVVDQNILTELTDRKLKGYEDGTEEKRKAAIKNNQGGGGSGGGFLHGILSVLTSAWNKVLDFFHDIAEAVKAVASAASSLFKASGLSISAKENDVQITQSFANDPELLSWATGQKCVNSSSEDENHDQYENWVVEGEDGNPNFWEEKGKYYQRYIEDQRILEQMGAFEDSDNKSTVTAYREQRAKETPIDNSYSGYIARMTGITKDAAEDLIAIAEYYQFVNDYDSSTRIAMENGKTTHITSSTEIANLVHSERSPAFTDDSNDQQILDLNAILLTPTIYADVRNRSYAA